MTRVQVREGKTGGGIFLNKVRSTDLEKSFYSSKNGKAFILVKMVIFLIK